MPKAWGEERAFNRGRRESYGPVGITTAAQHDAAVCVGSPYSDYDGDMRCSACGKAWTEPRAWEQRNDVGEAAIRRLGQPGSTARRSEAAKAVWERMTDKERAVVCAKRAVAARATHARWRAEHGEKMRQNWANMSPEKRALRGARIGAANRRIAASRTPEERHAQGALIQAGKDRARRERGEG